MKIKAVSIRKKGILYSVIAILCYVFFGVGVYHSTYTIIQNSNVEMIQEMSVHDRKAISNILLEQWNAVDTLVRVLRNMQPASEQDILSAVNAFNEENGQSVLFLVSDQGVFYRSDGVITTDGRLYDTIRSYDEEFAVCYDCSREDIVEKQREYLVIGKRIDDLTIGGQTFQYVARKDKITELDDRLRIDCFGGKGYSSLVDEDGSYIIKMNRAASVTERENLFKEMKMAQYKNGYSFDKIKSRLEKGDEGVAVEADYKDDTYFVYFTTLDKTNWYYIAIVPLSVFSDLTNQILFMTSILLTVIIAVVFVMIRNKTRYFRHLANENTEYNKKLLDSLNKEHQANMAKTVFLNNMSHDIRTPMNAIIGFTELAKWRIDDKEQVLAYLTKIAASSDHLLSLINDILDMSRIESGKVAIKEEKVNISEILNKIGNMFQETVRKKNQELILDMKGVRNGNILSDELRLNQVLINLVSNASKYTHNGGKIRITVRQAEKRDATHWIYEFHVKDNGIGMSEEFVATVFDSFARESVVVADGIQGTGLGMTITKNLVDLMGGTIECHSQKHVGTEIIIRLPVKVEETLQVGAE